MERPVQWKNVLLVRFGSLGDVVLTLPVVEAVRRHAPEARVSIAVKEAYSSLFGGGHVVDRVFPLSDSREHRGREGFRRYAAGVGAEPFDLLLDLHGSVRSRLLGRRVSARRVVRVSLERLSRRALVRFKKPLLGYPGHAVDRYLAAAEAAGIPPAGRIPRLAIPPEVRRRVGSMLDAAVGPSAERTIVLAPGAGRATKRWPADRFGDLARRLADEAGFSVAVTGSEGESDLVARVSETAGHPRVFPFVTSDLMEQGALLARASRMVTNDSGLMHLAAAVGTPVVALFGSTTTALGFYPLGARDVVLSLPLDCRPCGVHGLDRCPRGDCACLEGIPANRVFAAVCRGPGEDA